MAYISFLYLCGHIPPSLGGHKEWCRWPVQKGISLRSNLCLLHTVRDLLQIELSLYLCVPAALHGGRGAGTESVSRSPASQRSTTRLLLSLQLERVRL